MDNYSLENNTTATKKILFEINIKSLVPLLIALHILELVFLFIFSSHSQPATTNLLGFIGLIYSILIITHSVIFYRDHLSFFQTNSSKKRAFIMLAGLLSTYFVLVSVVFMMSTSTCRLDYFGGCGLMNLASTLIGLIGGFIYSVLIHKIEIVMKEHSLLATLTYFYFIALFLVFMLLFVLFKIYT